MKKSTTTSKPVAFAVRLSAIAAMLLAFTFLTVTAFMQGKGKSNSKQPPPAAAETTFSATEEFADPMMDSRRKESAANTEKEETKGKGLREIATPPGPNLITALTYAFSNTSAVALEDMSTGTTTLVVASSDDNNSVLADIGFDYWFDGVRATQFGVNGNGFARLGSVPTGASFTNSIATTTNAPKIMPFWDDLCVGTTGKVHSKTIGSAPNRKLIIEFLGMQITRGAGCAGVGGGTFQMWLFETTGVIEFVYGNGMVATAAADGGYSIGLQSGAATNFASVTTSPVSVSYAAANNTQTSAITSGTAYLFTPAIPADPSNLTFTGTTAVSTTLNWIDNSSNEFGFVIYRSTDGGVNYSILSQTAAGATSFTDNTVSPNTNYFYQVRAVSEGALSGAITNNVTTGATGNISSTAAGGNWSDTATWVGGVVPTGSDQVTIVNGATVTIDTAAVAFSVTVGTGGSPAVLQFEPTTARTLTVGSNVSIATNGTFQSAATGTVTTHSLSLAGNLTNSGILDFSTNANTAGAAITFTGAANTGFSGAGLTSDVRAISVNKGSSAASIVELTASNFTVQGSSADVAGYLTLVNGTFKISGSFAVTNRTFTTAAYTIPATGGIWLNNANYAIAATASGATTSNNGLLRVTQGIYNIGIGAGDQMRGGTGASFTIEGGTINVSGAFDPQNPCAYTQTGGIMNVGTVGNNVSNFGTFELFSTATTGSFTMSGGTINLVNPSTGATKVDYRNNTPTATTNITGGSVVIGAGAAPASSIYTVSGQMPSTTVNATHTMRVNNAVVFMRGTTVANNGIIDFTGANARYDFGSLSSAMTYGGAGVFGTLAVPVAGVGISANSIFQTTLSSPIVCNRVNLFQGGFTNSNQITLGNAGTSTTVVQIGSTGLTTPGGSFDVSPVHNQGTGGEILIYAFETAPRTTGVEINPTRLLTSIGLVDNPNGVTIAGGDLTLTSAATALTLTNGRLITGSNTLILSSGTALVARTNGYVDGNFRKNFAASASKVFEVGTANGFSPATINVTAGAPGDVTVRAVQGKQPNIPGTDALQRYWVLTAAPAVTADLTLQYLAADVVGTEASYQVVKYTGSFTNPAGSSVDTALDRLLAPAQSGFSVDWTAVDPAALVNPPGTLQFLAPTYSVAENGVLATITVTRTGGSGGPASINFATSNGTAIGGVSCTPGVDYVTTSGPLNWADGDSASKTFTITICNDAVFEGGDTVNLALSGATGAAAGSPVAAVLTITNDDPGAVPNTGDILISEFRYNGPNGANDEFVEIYNNTNSAVIVADSGAGTGWAVVSSDAPTTAKFVIPDGTTIPARGHFLATNLVGYSLGEYPSGNNGVSATTATGDITFTTDIPLNSGLALFRTSLAVGFVLAERLDAVGPASVANTLFKEGTGLPDIGAFSTDYSWARRLPGGCTGSQPGFVNHNCTSAALIAGTPAPSSGNVQDSNNNVTDFIFVDVNGTATPAGNQRLGAPGPENLTSPIVRNSTIKASLIDPAQSSSASPNRVRDLTPTTNGTFGTLDIRRKFTNNTGGAITRLRFRIMDISTFPALDDVGTSNDVADLRILTSTTSSVTITGGGTITVNGTTLEVDTTGNLGQPVGGGHNSSLGAGTVTLGTPLAAGASINVRLLFGVQQSGTFRVFLNVEALP